jgi:hypothetical protein
MYYILNISYIARQPSLSMYKFNVCCTIKAQLWKRVSNTLHLRRSVRSIKEFSRVDPGQTFYGDATDSCMGCAVWRSKFSRSQPFWVLLLTTDERPCSLLRFYILTLWSWALLERSPVVRPLDSFPVYGTRRFNTEFTRSLHLFLSWAR